MSEGPQPPDALPQADVAPPSRPWSRPVSRSPASSSIRTARSPSSPGSRATISTATLGMRLSGNWRTSDDLLDSVSY